MLSGFPLIIESFEYFFDKTGMSKGIKRVLGHLEFLHGRSKPSALGVLDGISF